MGSKGENGRERCVPSDADEGKTKKDGSTGPSQHKPRATGTEDVVRQACQTQEF